MSRRGVRNQYIRNKNKPEIFSFCSDMKLSIRAIDGDWHYRIENVMDVFPTKKRYCWLPTGEWGWYEDYESLGKIMMEHIDENS